jgi:hypothetical protein
MWQPWLMAAVVLVAGVGILLNTKAANADINKDGTVSILDLSILLSKFNTTDATADLNGDGSVTVLDLSILLTQWGTSPGTSTPTPTPTPTPAPVVAAVGDIACDPASSNFNGGAGTSSYCRDRYVAQAVAAANPAAILILGDAQYESGTYSAFLNSFDKNWGSMKSKIKPAPGNHEYNTSGASGYYDYFNGVGVQSGQAGDRSKGYYSFNVGAWHVIALNSNCSKVACAAGSTQESWLRSDLAANRNVCTVAYFHHPRWSSGDHGNNSSVQDLVDALYENNADLILAGHDHSYERFAPMNASGAVDNTRGIRHFVVGSGGKNHYAFNTPLSTSQMRNADTYGFLRLTLKSTSYDWKFVPEAGKTFTDTGTTNCH